MDYSKKSKEELIAEIKLLKNQEANISSVLYNIKEMFYKVSFDKKGNKVIDYISPQVENVLGFTTEEYINNQKKIFEHFHPKEIDGLIKETRKIDKSKKEWNYTYRFYHKIKKEYVWIDETIVPLFDKIGKKIGLLGTAKDVTDTKKQENQLSFILENLEECIYNVKFEKNKKRLNYISNKIEKITGLTAEEFQKEGKTGKLIKRIHPDDVDMINKHIEEGLYEKKKNQINTIFRFKPKGKKEYLWIEESVYSIYNNEGEILETTTVLRDITKQKEIENRLIISESSYKNIFNDSSDLIYIQKPTGEFIDVNKTVLLKYGYKKSEIIGKTPDFLAAKEGNNFEEVINKINLAWQGKKQTFEFYGKTKKGKIFIKDVIVKKGNYFGEEVIIATARDITESKNLEKQLIESEEKYKTFSNLSNEIVVIHDKGIVKEINNAIYKTLGYKPKELIGKSIIKLATKESAELVKKNIANNYKKIYEVEGYHKNGEKKYFEVVGKNINWKGEKLRAATLLDITDRKTFELHLKESEGKYRNIFTKNLAGVYITENGKIIECNNSFAKIFGYKSRVQLIGKSALDLYYSKSDRAKYIKELNKKGSLTNYRIRHKKADGSELWILTNVSKKENRIEGTLISITDEVKQEELSKEKLRAQLAEENNKKLQKEIGEKEKAEGQLIENQKYTNSIIDNSLDVICASDMNGNIIEFNKAGLSIFGYDNNEIKKKKAQTLYANKKDFIRVSKQLKANGTFIGEVNNIRKNGEIFTSFLSASLLYDQQGNEIGSMGISRDITELKEAENQLIESEEKYRDLFENATDLIKSVDIKGNIVYVNNAWKNKLGYTDEEIENKNIFEFIHPDCQGKCEQIFSNIIKNKPNKTKKVSYELKTKKGNKIIVEGNVSLRYKDGKPESTRAILRDVTDEIWDKTLQNVYNNITKIISEKIDAEKIYEGIRLELGKVMNTDVFIISYAKNKETVSFPYYYDNIYKKGRVFKEERFKGKGLNEYFLKRKKSKILRTKELDKLKKNGECKLSGKSCKTFIGVPLKIKNKTIGVVSVQSYTNENEYDNKTIQILEFISGALALAVQKKFDEEKIKEQTAKLRAIIESSSHLFWTYEKDKGLTTFNQNYSDAIFDLYGKRPNLVQGEKVRPQNSPKELYSFWDEKYKEALTGKKVEFITSRTNKKGTRIIRDVFLNPIFDENNNVSEVSGIAHDITEKTIAEEQLKESLKEKEILLKEVHHRVKNNLQVISSILNLQSSYVKEESTLNILKESQNRIKSMAFIHESLYQTNDFSQINFSEYVISLSQNLVHSYEVFDNFVNLKLQVKDVSLNLDQSIPCGLLINELISNALKYAFPNNKKGTITIALAEKDNKVYLNVKDNGVGLPNNIDYRDTDSLGLQLVMTLTEQLDGTIELDNTKGANYSITFKKD